MTCSPARLAANRRNAARSSGPKTDEGKARSRANALKHGLAAEVLTTSEEAQAVGAQPLAGWLEGEAVVLTMRIDRARRVEERERERAALRAETCWDADRRAEAERIGRGLSRNPGRVVARLKGTVQGCDWMIERWRWLLAAAGQAGGWNDEQHAIASELQGIPEAFRILVPGVEAQVALATCQATELATLRDALGRSDAFERETTRLGLADGATPELRRAIRYEAALHRRLRWCHDQLRGEVPSIPVVESPAPAPSPSARPEPVAPGPVDLDFDEEEDFSDLDALFGITPATNPFLVRGAIPVSILSRRRSE